jgi:hypothetical protein
LADPLYATKLELKDGDAEIGLLSSLLPTIVESGPAFPMQSLKRDGGAQTTSIMINDLKKL